MQNLLISLAKLRNNYVSTIFDQQVISSFHNITTNMVKICFITR